MIAQLSLPNSTNVRNALSLAWTRLHLGVSAALAPRTAVEKAARLFVTPPRFAHTPPERALLATGRGYTVTFGVTHLAAWRFGPFDAPAIVVSHGWGGRGAQFRHFVKPLVAAGFQVVLFDHAAHGHSEGEESSLVHFMNDLEAVANDLRTQGVRIAGLIGHSLGAASIGAWLKRDGSQPRVVLLAPPNSVERYSNHFARYLGISERVRREMQKRVERRLGMAWSEFEVPGAVAGIEAPALIIHDADDRDVAYASGLSVARAWKDARFVRTEGLGHRAILRDPAVVRDVLDFLTGEVEFARPPANDRLSPAPAPLF